ncbi:hypothetical protein GCM10023116_07790 [Kistimonas scapharcae]|uniref:Uncharacterized protein n=1 Tax=Kistimonas scapharcae TaxID=1036133 RepID=A0ABP8UXE7_9GAMM
MRATFNNFVGRGGSSVGLPLDGKQTISSKRHLGERSDGQQVTGDKIIEDFRVTTTEEEKPFDVDPTGVGGGPRKKIEDDFMGLFQQPENQDNLIQFIQQHFLLMLQNALLHAAMNQAPQNNPVEPLEDPLESSSEGSVSSQDDDVGEGNDEECMSLCCGSLKFICLMPFCLLFSSVVSIVVGAAYSAFVSFKCARGVSTYLYDISSCLYPLAIMLGSLVFVCTFVVVLPVSSVFWFGYMLYTLADAIIRDFPSHDEFLRPYPNPEHCYQHVYNLFVPVGRDEV